MQQRMCNIQCLASRCARKRVNRCSNTFRKRWSIQAARNCRDVLLLRNSGKSRLTIQARSITRWRGAQVAALTISFSKWKIRTFNFSQSLFPLIRSNFETISQIVPNTGNSPSALFRWNFRFLRILILLEFESYDPRAVCHVQFKDRQVRELKVTKQSLSE